MKRIYKKVFKSKKPYLGSESMDEAVPATSKSTLITSTTDLIPLIPSIPAQGSDATTASKQGTAGVRVSF